MVLRNIVIIDEEKCDGCGQCVNACVEGAIEMVNGKAKLVSDIYCDGLGACIGHCPQGAITVEQRQANAFDEEATRAYLASKSKNVAETKPQSEHNTEHSNVEALQKPVFACPGSLTKKLRERSGNEPSPSTTNVPSRLTHWPVQLKLVAVQAPYFNNADLLLVADCVPFAMGDFHNQLLKENTLVVGCPKLDDSNYYVEKMTEILKSNKIKSLTVVHMEVPCCSGLMRIARTAVAASHTEMEVKDITINVRGAIIE